jgi:hypothetical protein
MLQRRYAAGEHVSVLPCNSGCEAVQQSGASIAPLHDNGRAFRYIAPIKQQCCLMMKLLMERWEKQTAVFSLVLGIWLSFKVMDFAKGRDGFIGYSLELAALCVFFAPLILCIFCKKAYDQSQRDKNELEYYPKQERKAKEAGE